MGGICGFALVGGIFYLGIGNLVGDFGWGPALMGDLDESKPTSAAPVHRSPDPSPLYPVSDRHQETAGESESSSWECSWDPTMNRDWHDDVICTNGVDWERPYLLPNDDFVTEDEVAQAAREYQDELNGW